MADSRAFMVIATISAVTVGLRVLPFLALDRLATSRYLRFLGEQMPTGVMIVLVAYTLNDVDFAQSPYGLPQLGALVISAVMYARTSNALLSIGGALAAYLATVNVVLQQ